MQLNIITNYYIKLNIVHITYKILYVISIIIFNVILNIIFM